MRIVASSEAGDASTEIPAAVPVILYIARFHPFNQGFSGIYRKFNGFQLSRPSLDGSQLGVIPSPWGCSAGHTQSLALLGRMVRIAP
jgi:hypothetical protein